MPGRHQGPVRHQDPPAQLGTSPGAEKKSAAPKLTTAATNAVDAYENLRAAVLNAEPIKGPDLGMIRQQGMVRWLHGWTRQPIAEPRRSPAARPIANPSPATRELTRLLAGIVVTLTKDTAHA